MAGNPSGITPYQFVGVKGLVMSLVVGTSLLLGYLTHYPVTPVNLLMLGSLALYLWRLANPQDSGRVVSTAKFWG